MKKVLPLLVSGCLALGSGAAERVALVIGNGAYEHAAKLANATSDSTAIAKLLRNAGFEVIGSTDGVSNASTEQFYGALEKFKQAASGAKVGLVYYAGHGVEVDGKNYLLPVDASLESAAQLRTQAVPLDTILADMKEARLPAKMVILDCCRDNPLTRSWMTTRSTKRGMAEVKEDSLPEATMIMFSTAPGKTALDGTGGNSPFTKALLANLTQTGLNSFDAFLKVSDAVALQTSEAQIPWIKFDGAGRAFRMLSLAGSGGASGSDSSSGTKPRQEVETDPSKEAFWQQSVMMQLIVLATGSKTLTKDGLAKFIGTNEFVEGPPGETLTTMLRLGPEKTGLLPMLIFDQQQLVAFTVGWDFPTAGLTDIGLQVKDRGVFLVDPESETGRKVYKEFFGLIKKNKK